METEAGAVNGHQSLSSFYELQQGLFLLGGDAVMVRTLVYSYGVGVVAKKIDNRYRVEFYDARLQPVWVLEENMRTATVSEIAQARMETTL